MNDVSEVTGFFPGPGGAKIFYRHIPAESERARLVICHGLGEHSGRYEPVVNRLSPLGFSIWALDHPGHGRSEGPRGHVDCFSHYLDGTAAMLEIARENLPPDRPVFLLGHSLGGLIALRTAILRPDLIDGVAASSPGLGMIIEVPAAKKVLGRVMSKIWPRLSMSNELDATKISRDPAVVQAYQNDPLVHDRVTARWFTEFMGGMDNAQELAPVMKVPTLMQVAGADALVNPDASRRFFDRLGAADKTLHFYEGYYHEIFNEPEKYSRLALDDLAAWLEAHLTSPAGS